MIITNRKMTTSFEFCEERSYNFYSHIGSKQLTMIEKFDTTNLTTL